MEHLQQFHGIIAALLTNNNAEREAAEKQYNEVPINQRVLMLYQLGVDKSVAMEVRDMAFVLLRRLIADKYEDITSIIPGEFNTLKDQLIQVITNEEVSSLRKRMTDVLSDIARHTIDDQGNQQWSTIIEFIGHCAGGAGGDNAGLRETAMILIENVPNIFGLNQNQLLGDIKQMFKTSLLFQDDGTVRTAAVRAFVAFIVDNEDDDNLIRQLADLIPDVLKVCEHVTVNETDDDVPLQCMIDLATTIPKQLSPYFQQIFQLCLTTASQPDKDESYRQSSMEILVSLCESAPALIRKKATPYIEPLVQQCLQMMTELDDDVNAWLEVDDAEDDIEEEMVALGETSVDRVACSLGPKPVFPPAYRVISNYISSQNWKERHAGIFALSTIGEGCKRQMEPHIREIVVDALLPLLKDEHARVRYAACNAIGQMSSDFGPTLQKKCHEKVVPALLEQAVDLNTPRVSAHALAAFVNFSEDCPKAIISIYLDQIMEKMQWILENTFNQLVQNRKKIVLFQVITTVASIADSAQEHFSKYYSALMPPLKYILANSNDKELSELHGKTIECISLIGLAVGRELFGPDILEIMTVISKGSLDDDNASYVISAWARICKVLQHDFAPYLQAVMPLVMKCANFSPEMSLLEEEEEKDENEWDVVELGDSRLGIHTAGLDDKNTACEMLVCFAREMKTAFAPYVEQVTEFMESQLKFLFHDGVRSAAAEIFPHLFAASRDNGPEYRKALWVRVFPQLLDALSSENDLEVAGEFLYSIGASVEELGIEIVSREDLQKIVTEIHSQMEKYEKRRKEREEASKDEEVDEETQEELKDVIEMETDILGRISDLVHYCFSTFKENFVETFAPVFPQFVQLVQPNRPFQDRQWAFCIFDDLIEFGGPVAASNFSQAFVEPMLNGLHDEYAEVRQAAAYGVGVMGLAPHQSYNHFLSGAVERLVAMIGRPDARSTEESTIATENAISAVSKILKNSNAVDSNLVIPTFLTWLPVWEDTEETPFVYDYFCDLVENNHPAVLGDNNSNLPSVVNIVLQAFHHDAIDDSTELAIKTKQRCGNIIKVLSQNKELFEAILQSLKLNSSLQQTLQVILQS